MSDGFEKILVTGGSGFIGTNLLSELIAEGCVVLNVDIVEPRCISQKEYWRNIDLRNRVDVFAVIKEFKPTQIYHLGARTDLDSNDVTDYSANIDGVINLIDACVAVNSIKRVIFASSRLVCRIGYQPISDNDYCPTTAYGESKVLGEKIVRDRSGLSFDWVIVRPTSIWGPWFGVPYRLFFDHVRARRYVHPGSMKIIKSFGYVANTVFQLRKLMEARAHLIATKTFYLGDYDPIDVGEFSRVIAAEFGVADPISLPVWMLNVLAKAGDMLVFFGYKNAPLTSFRLQNLKSNMIHDFSEISSVTGSLPYTAEQGVRKTVSWMTSESRA